MWHLGARRNRRHKKTKYVHIEKVFIFLKICNLNYFSVKPLIHKENRFNTVTPTAKKGNSSPCGRKANYRAANPWNEYSAEKKLPTSNTNMQKGCCGFQAYHNEELHAGASGGKRNGGVSLRKQWNIRNKIKVHGLILGGHGFASLTS
jgi:hypothetical protein